jgi:hypothetical protein
LVFAIGPIDDYMVAVFVLPPLLPFTKRLLVVLAGFYLVEIIVGNWMNVPLSELLTLHTGSLGLSTLWEVVTYPAAFDTSPSGVIGTLISLLFLWWMVSPVEQLIGIRRTATVSAVASLGGASAAVGVGLLFDRPDIVFGPGPIFLAAIATFGIVQRGRQVLFFGVFPIQATHMIWVAVGFSVLFFLTSKNVIQLVADLGALGAAVLYWRFGGPTLGIRKKKKAPLRSVPGGQARPKWMN